MRQNTARTAIGGRAAACCLGQMLSQLWEGRAHITRCRLERRMPPLKIDNASPMLQMAWPGRGCRPRCVSVSGLARIEPGTYLHVKPLLRTRRQDLEPSETVVKECLRKQHELDEVVRVSKPGMLTKVPKSVWAPMPTLLWLGGVFTTLASLPLSLSVVWRSARAPLGSPRSRSKISRIVLLTAIDFRTKGVTASFILSFTVGG